MSVDSAERFGNSSNSQLRQSIAELKPTQMVKMIVDGVEVSANLPNFSEQEARRYVNFVRSKVQTPLREISVTLCDDGKVDVNYYAVGEKFERIRRITGYLTGDLKSWNNAKQAEERDRVKHNGR